MKMLKMKPRGFSAKPRLPDILPKSLEYVLKRVIIIVMFGGWGGGGGPLALKACVFKYLQFAVRFLEKASVTEEIKLRACKIPLVWYERGLNTKS